MKRVFLLLVVVTLLTTGLVAVAQDDEINYLAAIPVCEAGDFVYLEVILLMVGFDHDDFVAALQAGDAEEALKVAEKMTGDWPIYSEGLSNCSTVMYVDSLVTNMTSSAHLSALYLDRMGPGAEEYIEAY
ncbi:hypothetical protein ACFLYO_11790, partial [Chloroflexota bacterium]